MSKKLLTFDELFREVSSKKQTKQQQDQKLFEMENHTKTLSQPMQIQYENSLMKKQDYLDLMTQRYLSQKDKVNFHLEEVLARHIPKSCDDLQKAKLTKLIEHSKGRDHPSILILLSVQNPLAQELWTVLERKKDHIKLFMKQLERVIIQMNVEIEEMKARKDEMQLKQQSDIVVTLSSLSVIKRQDKEIIAKDFLKNSFIYEHQLINHEEKLLKLNFIEIVLLIENNIKQAIQHLITNIFRKSFLLDMNHMANIDKYFNCKKNYVRVQITHNYTSQRNHPLYYERGSTPYNWFRGAGFEYVGTATEFLMKIWCARQLVNSKSASKIKQITCSGGLKWMPKTYNISLV